MAVIIMLLAAGSAVFESILFTSDVMNEKELKNSE